MGVGVGERVAVGEGVEVGSAVAVGSGVGVGTRVGIAVGRGVAVDTCSAVGVGTGVTVGEGAGIGVATRAAVKVGAETSVGSVVGVSADPPTAVVLVVGGASDVARTSVATITVASTVGAVVGVEIGACVGWPPVQARAARVIIARNARATGLIYQLLVSSQSQQAVPDHRDIRLGHTIPSTPLSRHRSIVPTRAEDCCRLAQYLTHPGMRSVSGAPASSLGVAFTSGEKSLQVNPNQFLSIGAAGEFASPVLLGPETDDSQMLSGYNAVDGRCLPGRVLPEMDGS